MAGNRVGYLVGPPALIAEARKIGTHPAYAAPTAGQMAALRALEGGAPWVERAHRAYREVADEAAALLGQPPPQGSTFLFLDVRSRLDDRGLQGLLEDLWDSRKANVFMHIL